MGSSKTNNKVTSKYTNHIPSEQKELFNKKQFIEMKEIVKSVVQINVGTHGT